MSLRWAFASLLSGLLVAGCGDESTNRAPKDSTDQITTAPAPKNAAKKSPSKFQPGE